MKKLERKLKTSKETSQKLIQGKKAKMKRQEKINKEENGITLIALVITIVILIILATITVNFIFGENGVINRAQQGTEEYNKSDIEERVTILQSEFLIDKASGEEDNFADFLRKELQVGVTQDEEGKYNFAVDGWQVKATENNVISIEKLNVNPDKVYPNVASMKADTGLTEGKLVQTESYWDKQYGGSAYYDIVSSTILTVDDGKCIQLDNGLYAELHPINDTVTVNQFGAYGDGEHNDATSIQTALNSKYRNICFESEEYKICNDIRIQNNDIYLLGNNSTIFYEDDMNWGDDFVIRIAGTSSEVVKNITIDNLNIESRDTGISDKALRFIKMFYVEDIELTNCDFLTPEIENNSVRRMTGIDCRVYYKNVDINNCNIKIYTNGLAGGGIWLRTGTEGTGNVKIYNNYIEKTSHDELIAIFESGTIKNVKIEGNTLINRNYKKIDVDNYSYPVFSFGLDSAFAEDIEFINNKLDIDTGGATFTWYDKVKNFYIANNTMKINIAKPVETFGVTSFGMGGNADLSVDRNIVFDNNDIEINELDISKTNTHRLINGATGVKNNKITMNVYVSNIVSNAYEISNNQIYLNKELGGMVSFEGRSNLLYCNMNIQKDILYQNNTIYFADTIENTNLSLINFKNFAINGKKVNITGNTIVENNNYNVSLLLLALDDMLDNTSQYIYMSANDFGHFSKIYRNNTKDVYDIITN